MLACKELLDNDNDYLIFLCCFKILLIYLLQLVHHL